MNRYTVTDSRGIEHQIDADALNAEAGLLNFSKKGAPGYIAQFRDWASYVVEPLPPQAPEMTPFVPFEPVAPTFEEAVAQKIAADDADYQKLNEATRVKRPYNRKA